MKLLHHDPRMRRLRRRRGAALVLVLIFGVGALMLISTMLTISDKTAQASGEVQRHRNLQAVLKAGIGAAVNEINRHGTAGVPYDPDGRGVGALTGTNDDGVPVTVQDARGQTVTIGFYRATVSQSAPHQILTVVAAWPSFAEPATGELDRRIFAAAQMDIAKKVTSSTINTTGAGPFRPINIVGVDPSDLDITVTGNPKLNIIGKDDNPSGHLNPTKANVPGANIHKSGSKDEFVSTVIDAGNNQTAVSGANPTDLQGPIVSGSGTVTNSESTVFNETTMTNARTSYQQKVQTGVNDALGGAANHSTRAGGTFNGGGAGATFPGSGANNVIVVTGNLQIEGKVSGSGTLIIRDSLTVKGDFTWDGDVIIAGYDAANSNRSIVNNATVTMDSGAKLGLTGNMIMLGNGVKYTDQSSGGGQDGNAIDGAFLMLANDDSTATIEMKNGSNTEVEGVLSVFSEKIVYKAEQGSHTTIRSLNLVTPHEDNDNDNDVDVIIEQGSETDLVYDNTQVLEAVTPILNILGGSLTSTETTTHTNVEIVAYWETDARALFDAQKQAITDNEPLGWDADN